MSYRNHKNNGGSHRKITLGGVAAIVLAGVILSAVLTAGIGFLSKGYTDNNVKGWFESTNEKNLINPEKDYMSKLPPTTEKGLKLDWKDNGKVVLTGSHNDGDQTSEYNHPIPFANVTVEAGTYILSTGNKYCGEKTFGLKYEYIKDGETVVGYVADKPLTLEFDQDTTIKLSIYVRNGEKFYGIFSYIIPTLEAVEAVEADSAN